MKRPVIIIVAALAAALAAVLTLRSPAAGISAVTPPNPHGRFKGECGLCHGAEGWTPAHISPRFNHAKFGFALDGAHAAAACRACHATLDFSQEKTQCVGCHQDVHQGELGADCARCHTPRSFIDRAAMVRAHQLTRFPLSGAHASLDCESCHPPAVPGHLQFVGTSPNCAGCHMADYRATTTPDHVAANFPTACQNCHSNIAWRPASFDHDRTAFPLTGAHRSTPCLSCHGDGVYAGKSTACVSCHQTDYNNTTNPVHGAAGFSTACQTCHNTISWAGATFDHDALYFRIYSGAHAGRWSACSDCHSSPASYLQFTCLTCHQQATTDSRHSGISGYSYDSNACYSCHRGV